MDPFSKSHPHHCRRDILKSSALALHAANASD